MAQITPVPTQRLFARYQRPAGVTQVIENNGGQGRNRTNDTRIFSPLLYQLSYLAMRGVWRLAGWTERPDRQKGIPEGRVLERWGCGQSRTMR